MKLSYCEPAFSLHCIQTKLLVHTFLSDLILILSLLHMQGRGPAGLFSISCPPTCEEDARAFLEKAQQELTEKHLLFLIYALDQPVTPPNGNMLISVLEECVRCEFRELVDAEETQMKNA